VAKRPNVNIILQDAIFKAQDLTTPEKIVALCLVWHRNQKTGRCDPGQARICLETGLKERAVRDAIHGLTEKQVIVTTRTQKTTRYEFCARNGSLDGLPASGAGPDRRLMPVGKPRKKPRYPKVRREITSRADDGCATDEHERVNDIEFMEAVRRDSREKRERAGGS